MLQNLLSNAPERLAALQPFCTAPPHPTPHAEGGGAGRFGLGHGVQRQPAACCVDNHRSATRAFSSNDFATGFARVVNEDDRTAGLRRDAGPFLGNKVNCGVIVLGEAVAGDERVDVQNVNLAAHQFVDDRLTYDRVDLPAVRPKPAVRSSHTIRSVALGAVASTVVLLMCFVAIRAYQRCFR